MQLRSQDAVLRNGKRTELANQLGPTTPLGNQPARRRNETEQATFRDLPDELLLALMCQPTNTAKDVCSWTCASSRLAALAAGEVCQSHWRWLFEREFGEEITALQEDAAKLAGSWSRLFAARHLALKEAFPHQKPSSFELQAAVHRMMAPLPEAISGDDASATSDEMAIVFLVDASGSVSDADFECMQGFMRYAAELIAAPPAEADPPPHVPPSRKLAVVQFSNEVRVELAPTALTALEFDEVVSGMQRMNGGTNIAAALQAAGQLLKPLGPRCRRVLALLTDARVDDYQLREARDMAARLADEQRGVTYHAFGVGRGVDATDMHQIIGAHDPDAAPARYLPLHVEEAPW